MISKGRWLFAIVTFSIISSIYFRYSNTFLNLSHNFEIQSTYLIHDTSYIREHANIRYAAFGTSDTYGSGIVSDIDRRKLAYPFLLSPHAKNYAIRASSPDYPRACAQSIIDGGDYNSSTENIFDVIILEYFARVEKGLKPLVQRLRERFPDAVIIILREWNPLMNVFVGKEKKDGNRSSIDVCKWAKTKNVDMFNEPEMRKIINEESDYQWEWKQIFDEYRISIQFETAHEFGAYILPMELPDDPRNFINYLDLFSADCHHKSAKGHSEVAHRISNLLERIHIKDEPRVGKWSFHDTCVTWFESGNTKNINYSDEVILENFVNKNGKKYALSFYEKKGTVTMTNPTDEGVLYLTYMSTGPSQSNYPETQVKNFHHDKDKEQDLDERQELYTIVLDPNAQDSSNGVFVHIQKMKKIGRIPRGDIEIEFQALNDSKWPFRLVSIAITMENEEYNFGSNPGKDMNLN